MCRRPGLRIVLVWLVGAMLLSTVVPLQAQEGMLALADRAKFVAITLTGEGPSLAEFRAAVGQPLVVLVRNNDQIPHCLIFAIPPAGRLAEIDLDDLPASPLDCQPDPSVVEPVVTGPPLISSVDLDALQAGLQCGPQPLAGGLTGEWAYQLSRPLAPRERFTLCFIVAAPGRYPYYDPLDPTQQGLLIINGPGSETGLPVVPPTATPQPPPSPTPGPPTTLPEAGADRSSTPAALGWLLLGSWVLVFSVLAWYAAGARAPVK